MKTKYFRIANKKDPLDWTVLELSPTQIIKIHSTEDDDYEIEEISKERFDFAVKSMVVPQ